MSPSCLDITESQEESFLRLSLVGELDFASSPVLEDRLARLRGKRMAVRLDLSKLEFIDSTGLRLLIRTFGDARTGGWKLDIDGELSPTVRSLFKLVHFDHFVADREATETDSPPAEPRAAAPPL